jgi:hypothetical protein
MRWLLGSYRFGEHRINRSAPATIKPALRGAVIGG